VKAGNNKLSQRRSRCGRLLVAIVLVLCALEVPAGAYEARVPDGYFGVSAPELVELARNSEIARLDRHSAGMKAAGIDWARITFDWRLSEPLVPLVDGAHVYDWTWTDRLVSSLARHDITLVPNPVGAPLWARDLQATLAGCSGNAAVALSRAADFGAYTEAIVRRYGRNGTFWAQNPGIPYRPVQAVEVWNEPNWHGSWCPSPDPEAVAPVLAAGARGVDRADPQARVVLGGLATIKTDARSADGHLRGIATDSFLREILASEPNLAQLVDSVGIHLYESDPSESLSLLGWLRRNLNSVGLAHADMLVTEFGWSTVGPGSVTESARAENYSALLNVLPRTDCGLSGIAPHSWFTFESDTSNPEHWFGIVNPTSADPYASGAAYAAMIETWNGAGETPPPRNVLEVCNASPPDQDGDGWPDENDDYPFDPTRHEGANEPPPPPDGPPQEERTRPALVPDEFFGATDVWLPEEGPQRQAHYDAMRAAGFGLIRQQLIWRNIEPVLGGGGYAWAETDRRALALARRGMRMLPVLINPPAGVEAGGPQVDAAYAAMMGSLAERYGSRGSYWAENGHLDRSLAVRDYEVWQAGNAPWGAWDGTPSAAEYARTYGTTRAAIRAADPQGRAIASLVDRYGGSSAGRFLQEMVQAAPALRGGIDGVYVMAKDARSGAEAEATAADVRSALEATGNSQAKLYVGFGVSTHGEGGVPEPQRASLMSEIANTLPRSDCGVDGAFAFAWATRSEDPANPFDWHGIAALADATLMPTGEALRTVVRSFTGYGEVAPPRVASHGCFRQALDRDADGAPDPVDSHPLDPAQKGSAPEPPSAPSFSSAPPEWSAVRGASLSYSAARATGYQCRLDGGAWRSCGATYSTGDLADGRHTVTVRGIDAAGIVGAQSEHAWTVDTQAPSVAIDAGPGPLTLSDTVTFSMSSNEPGSFRCQHDSGPWRDCGATERIQGLPDGNHMFRVVAVDRAGNATGTYAARGFETRTVPRTPSILSITGTPGQSPKASFEAAFATSYECRYDDEEYAPCSGASSHVPPVPLSHGAHRFYVRGVGGTGTRGPAASAPVQVVDSIDPETRIEGGPDGVALRDSVSFKMASDDPHATFWCKLDAGPWAPCPAEGTFDGLADGEHVLLAFAVDSANNYDKTPAERRFEVRTQPAQAVITAGPAEGAETGPLPRFEFRIPFAARAECRFDSADFDPCSDLGWHQAEEPLAAGPHTFEVRGMGGTGKEGPAAARAFVVVPDSPQPEQWCQGKTATIAGTDAPDDLEGTPAADVIFLGGGADTVASGPGNDVICGGGGDDRLAGDEGRDILIAGSGRDRCRGGAGRDRLRDCER
jgi:hypothetical protein